jgi:hypothetical protein
MDMMQAEGGWSFLATNSPNLPRHLSVFILINELNSSLKTALPPTGFHEQTACSQALVNAFLQGFWFGAFNILTSVTYHPGCAEFDGSTKSNVSQQDDATK